MITAERESNVPCATCGKDAIRRTVDVRFPGKGGCAVSYDTHSRSLTDSEWHAALGRLHAFHEKVFALKVEMNAMPRPVLGFGMIESFDIDTVHPDACSRRTDVFIIAQVRAFGMVVLAKVGPLLLEGLETHLVLEQMVAAAEESAAALKARFDSGRF
jgi:hypothetical protein